ncbi:MAG: ABC transporter ATP-binding protein [Rickettsiales bacterium]|nr:ABC transporter ATP-binding protein [Rickettsiales bacterium]
MSSTPAIHITQLVKHYRGQRTKKTKQALHGVDLSIPQGSFYGLLGPNGAGKSTLINIVAGLTVKTSGNVIVNGIDMDDDPRGIRFQIGAVPQEVVLDPFFTVREMLDIHAGYYGVPKKKRRTDEILEALRLTDKANVSSRQLSGGMKRRVLIAKALVHNPPILILDEPTAGVDVELRQQLWDYVRTLNRQGTTVLLTTHYLEEAQELCDSVSIINHGKIIASDSTKNLLRIIDRKQITFRYDGKLKAVPEAFTRFQPKQTEECTLTLTYRSSETTIEELLAISRTTGLSIQDISTEEPDLEDTFRFLVANK